MSSLEIVPVNLDVVAVELMPVEHLLRSLGAGAWIPFAPDGSLTGGDRSMGSSAGHGATVGYHVHVRCTATCRGR